MGKKWRGWGQVKGSERGHKHEPGDGGKEQKAKCLFGKTGEMAELHRMLISAEGPIASV